MAQEAAVIEAKGPQALPQRAARRRTPEGERRDGPLVRYFLAASERTAEGGGPALGRELTSENEALIESLKAGVKFYAVSEYRAVPDVTGKAPLIRKEAVGKAVTSEK